MTMACQHFTIIFSRLEGIIQVLPVLQEHVHSFVFRSARSNRVSTCNLLPDGKVRLGLHFHEISAVLLCSTHLSEGTDHTHANNDRGENAIGHIHRARDPAVTSIIPTLPVLPCCVMCSRSGLVAPSTVGITDSFVECLRLTTGPSYTVDIIELTFGGVAEEVIGSNDETIAF